MTTGELLDSRSNVSGVTAIEHLNNIKLMNMTVSSGEIVHEEPIGLVAKDDIISLINVNDEPIKTKKETEAMMEALYGIQKD